VRETVHRFQCTLPHLLRVHTGRRQLSDQVSGLTTKADRRFRVYVIIRKASERSRSLVAHLRSAPSIKESVHYTATMWQPRSWLFAGSKNCISMASADLTLVGVTNLPAIPPGGSRVSQRTANNDALLVRRCVLNCNVKVAIRQRAGAAPPHADGDRLSGVTSDRETFFISAPAGVVGGLPLMRARNPWAIPEAST
jgi:hypothetical protein